jgi:hypothetical protein
MRNPKRPPKQWFYHTVQSLRKKHITKTPRRLAGWIWYHGMKPETRRKILRLEKNLPAEEHLRIARLAIQQDKDTEKAKIHIQSYIAEIDPGISSKEMQRRTKALLYALGLEKDNPIVVYNPPEAQLIYDLILEIKAEKRKHPKWKGERFKHEFSRNTHAQIWGLPDGSLLIKSKKGVPLWRRE